MHERSSILLYTYIAGHIYPYNKYNENVLLQTRQKVTLYIGLRCLCCYYKLPVSMYLKLCLRGSAFFSSPIFSPCTA